MEVVLRNSLVEINRLRSEIMNYKNVSSLQERVDQSEKMGLPSFHDFDDVEILQWYLFKPEHLNREHDKSLRTIKEYQKEITLFISHLLSFSYEIGLDIDDIKDNSLFKSLEKRHLRRYQEWLATKSPHVQKKGKYSPATLSRKTIIIKNFFQYLFQIGYIKTPVHEGLLVATVRKDDRPNRDLGPKEVKQLLDYFNEHNHPIAFSIIHVLVTTGLRNEEFCKLKVKDVQYDSIHGNYYLKITGKGNKRRDIPLREKTLNSIKMFREARGLPSIHESDKDSPLFVTNNKKPYSPSYLSQQLSKMIQRTKLPFLENCQVKITPHVFRHSFSIISHLSGVDIYDIMRSLGHEKIDTTMIYLEKIFEKEKHAIHGWKPEIFGEYI